MYVPVNTIIHVIYVCITFYMFICNIYVYPSHEDRNTNSTTENDLPVNTMYNCIPLYVHTYVYDVRM